MVEQLQPNLGAFANIEELMTRIQPNPTTFANIEKMIEQLQPNLGAFANIERMVEQAQLANIETLMTRIQPNLGAFANIERMVEQAQLANIETLMTRIQPNLGAFANIETLMTRIQPNLGAFANIERMVEQLQPNLGAFANIERMVEQLQPNLGAFANLEELTAPAAERDLDIESSVLAADSTDAVAPPSLSADLQDVPEGVLEVVTEELLLRLSTWCDLHGVLVGIEGLKAARLEVARQIDQDLSRLARTLDSDGVCWDCGGDTLTPSGITCAECAPVIAPMMLECVCLAEGIY